MPDRAQSTQGTPPEGADQSTEDGKPKRRRTGLLVGVAVVLVVVLGAGAALYFVPGLAERVGLGGAEEVAVAPPPEPVSFQPSLKSLAADAPSPTPAGVEAALAGPAADPVLGSLAGVVVDPATGQTLFSRNADTALVPASTTKVLSSAAALLALPHTQQLSTKVVAGDQPGTVVIVGGGDPTLNSRPDGEDNYYPGSAHLDDLVAQVRASGKPVQTVMVDTSRYTGEGLAPGWLPGDVAGGYIAPTVPLMLDGGRQDPLASTTPRTGNPARTLAETFAQRIGATVPEQAAATAPQGAEVLGEVLSAPMVELVDTAMQRSDNVLSEHITREVAIGLGKEPSFAGATAAVVGVLKDNGFDTSSLQLSDGSGLSTENRVAAPLLAEILKVAAAPEGADPRTAKLRPLLGGLPVAGGSGTLATRYTADPAAVGKGWVRAKTGTLSSVNSLAGVVLDQDGRLLVFALMSNGSDAGAARPALDAVAAALRQCGCR